MSPIHPTVRRIVRLTIVAGALLLPAVAATPSANGPGVPGRDLQRLAAEGALRIFAATGTACCAPTTQSPPSRPRPRVERGSTTTSATSTCADRRSPSWARGYPAPWLCCATPRITCSGRCIDERRGGNRNRVGGSGSVPGSAFGSRCRIPEPELGTWNLEPGTWNSEPTVIRVRLERREEFGGRRRDGVVPLVRAVEHQRPHGEHPGTAGNFLPTGAAGRRGPSSSVHVARQARAAWEPGTAPPAAPQQIVVT